MKRKILSFTFPLLFLSLALTLSAQDNTDTLGKEGTALNCPAVLVNNPFKGFCIGITTQTQLTLPATVLSHSDNNFMESRPGIGGEVGLELSYHFKYFGFSVGADFGTFAVIRLKPHLERMPTAEPDNAEFQMKNSFSYDDRYHNVMFPIKAEFHIPLKNRFWLIGDLGVKLSPPYNLYETIGADWIHMTGRVADPSVKVYTSLLADLGFAYILPYGDILRCSIGTNVGFQNTSYFNYTIPIWNSLNTDQGQISTRNHSLNLQVAYLHTFHKYKMNKHDQSWREVLPSHEFQFNIGDPILIANSSVLAFFNNSDGIFHNYISRGSSPSFWTRPLGDYAITRYVPVFSFNYHYRVAKWFWVGGLTTFTGIHNTWRDRLTDKITGHGSEFYFSIMPDIRFSYLNRKHVTLYSGLGFGMEIEHIKDPQVSRFFTDRSNQEYNVTSIFYSYQLTAFGIKAGGNHWFGNMELGIGSKGFVSAGFGYDF
ncbi:MAG: hypothetical protein J6S56_02390 [Bacteroidales bacterium]|nr:hypothetical protein [Bacteroidales bacterium]